MSENQVRVVPAEYVAQVWSDVESYLKDSVATGTGHCTLDQVKMLLLQGKQTMLVSVVDSKVTGAMVMEVYNTQNERVAHITALGGINVVDEKTFSQVESWARSQGATKVRAWAQEAQARLYRQKAGFESVRYVVEKSL